MVTRRKRRSTDTEIPIDDTQIEESQDTNELKQTSSKRKELNLIRHTETIDRLVIQNKNLQKDLDDADYEIEDLENKLADNSIKISKNMLYTFLGVIIFLAWILNSKIVLMNNAIIESNQIMQQYKSEIEKKKLYNNILSKKIKE